MCSSSLSSAPASGSSSLEKSSGSSATSSVDASERKAHTSSGSSKNKIADAFKLPQQLTDNEGFLDLAKIENISPADYVQLLASQNESVVRGNLHHSQHSEFWEKTDPGSWVSNVRKYGYKMPLTEAPPAYHEKNNSSAVQEMNFVVSEVNRLVSSGAVCRLKNRAHCSSPLTVASRVKEDGSVKHRLCWDGSRHVNQYIGNEHLKFADLSVACSLLEKDDLQVSYDLQSAYHHVLLHPSMVKYMGFELEIDGELQFFAFLIMAFGIKSAAHALTRIMKPISAYFFAHGIRHSVFLDDGKVNARTADEIKAKYIFVLQSLQQAGLVTAPDKSDSPDDARTSIKYLGFNMDSTQMKVFAPEKKVQSAKSILNELLKSSKIDAHKLSCFLGKLISLIPALGPPVRLLTRTAYALLQQHVDIHGYKKNVYLDMFAHHELELLLRHFDEFNGHPIERISMAQVLKCKLDKEEQVDAMAGDASANGAFAYSLGSMPTVSIKIAFTKDEQAFSSAHRELLTILRAFQHLPALSLPTKENRHLLWLTDSTNVVAILQKGSPKAHLQEIAVDIFRRAAQANVKLYPLHLAREEEIIQAADAESRIRDADDWSIDRISFSQLQAKSPKLYSVDLFASSRNTKNDMYYSKYVESPSAGTDAFSQTWAGHHAWVCPPINMLSEVWRRLRKENVSGTLVFPKWRTAKYWPIIFPDGKHAARPAVRLTTFQPFISTGDSYTGTMTGFTDYSFIALEFDNCMVHVTSADICILKGCLKCQK